MTTVGTGGAVADVCALRTIGDSGIGMGCKAGTGLTATVGDVAVVVTRGC